MAKNKRSRGVATLIDTTRFHLVDSLRLDDSLTQTRAWEDVMIREALLRGANAFAVIDRIERRHGRRPTPGQSALSLGPDPLSGPWADHGAVWDVSSEFRERARQELASLPGWVQESFDFDLKEKKRLKNPEPGLPRLDYYIAMRAALYQNGYDDPAEAVFRRITQATLLGKKIIGGIHLNFADTLSRLEKLLEAWSPGLARRTAESITGVGGFVPRFIAQKQGQKGPSSLSNHALGLAIDVDYVSNPHIKDRDVVTALREATGVDFGKPFVEYSKDIPPVDRVAQIHMVAREGSEAIQRWLQRWLPTFTELENRKRIKASFPDAVSDSETDRNMRLLQTITRFHKRSELETWSTLGVQSIPLELAAGMQELGFRWGSTYEHHKDAMHFELLPEKVLPRDAKPRSPDDVLRLIAG